MEGNGEQVVQEEPCRLRLDIDQYDLVGECANQPRQREYFGRRLAAAQLAMDEAKAQLAVCAARLDRAVRADPVGYGMEGKATETSIANTVLLQPEHQEALHRYNEARHEVAVMDAVVEALVDRKKSLANMVELHTSGYFSAVRAGGRPARRREEGDDDGWVPAGVRGRRRREEDGDGDG